jgi:uncharacterized BrkB/YihY/UPF0761 family membrane protein
LLSFGIVVSLWPEAAVTFTLTEALNAAYGVEETRSRRKRFVFALVFVPSSRSPSSSPAGSY